MRSSTASTLGTRKAGYLRVNAFPAQDHDWDATVAWLEALGVGDELGRWTRPRSSASAPRPAFRDGLWMRSAASIQPARLARGLRRVLLERGVRIHEGTRVRSLSAGSGRMQLETDDGRVFAEQVVLAINAWASGWPGFRSRLLAWGSYMVATEPIPDRLAELGWTGGELLSDSRFTISYFRTTRTAGSRSGRASARPATTGASATTFTHDQHAIARVVANFRHLLPMLGDVRLEDAWGGPIDITGHRFPEIGSTHGGRMHFAHGFAGNGAGPSRLAGRILADARRRRRAERSRRCPSSGAGSRSCRRSRSATSARGWSARRSSARTTRSTPGGAPRGS